MRINQPVTQKEVLLNEQHLIVSKTDLKGQITYINRDFIEISGFTEAELLGQPHNIVRHPDMPVEAFADLWRDLKAGRPWRGFVKNRCKNGDHYWVDASTTPIKENGQVVGYLSIRRKANAQDIAVVERAYAAFREKRAAGLEILHGRVVASGLRGRLQAWRENASASKKITLVMLLGLLVIFGAFTKGMSVFTTQILDERSRAVLQHDVTLVRSLLQTNLDTMKREATQLNRALDAAFPEGFALDTDAGKPVLRHGRTELNGNFAPVDRFTAQTGAVATLFVADGTDFLRVTTSLKKENGERAVGTKLDREHPAYALLSAGQPYAGRATLFGKEYFTSYTPLKNAGGQVIGASFIGMDITKALESLKAEIRNLKIGETGYYYVLDGSPGKNFGSLVIHPTKEGANILGAKDAAGREFIREMVERKTGEIIYPWMNSELGETSPRDKFVVFDVVPSTQWVVAGGTYMDEFRGLSVQVSRLLLIGGALVSLVIVGFLAMLIRKMFVNPLQDQVLPVFAAIGEGRYDTPISVASNDEVGRVMQGLLTMQMQQGFNVAESERLANDNLRIRIALDCVTANLRIADDDGKVIYANRGLLNTLRQIEPSLREQQPGFAVDRFIGSNIGAFYADPQAALKTLRELQTTRQTELDIGGRIYNVITNPIINDRGQRLGTVGEWVDRTAELNAQRSVAELIQRASAGDLAARLDTEALEGFYRELGSGINSLLETSGAAIGEIAQLLSRVAEGDLTQTVGTQYGGTFGRLRDDANQTVERLRALVGDIQLSAETINTAAKEIAVGNQDLSSRTEEQASSLEETASSMEELTATVKQNADNARQANELASVAQQVAERGGAVVSDVVTTMSSIHQASSRIADIIGVIDGIAFQTNILALNAAVEAARAGEQGRGFAVVATEVRNLAQRSAAAAKEIKGLISDSVDKVEAGNRLVDQAGRTMDDVVASIKRVARIVTDIADASREQSSGIEQIGHAVTQMDEVTQQNAALVEQAAAAAESLEEQATQLARSVQVFRVSEHGGAARRLEAPAGASSSAPGNAGGRRQQQALPASLDDEWAEF